MCEFVPQQRLPCVRGEAPQGRRVVNPSVSLTADSSLYTREPLESSYTMIHAKKWSSIYLSDTRPLTVLRTPAEWSVSFLILVYTLDIGHRGLYRPDLWPFCQRQNIRSCRRRDRRQTTPHRGVAVSHSNLARSAKNKKDIRMVSFLFVISVHFRYQSLEQVPARFVTNSFLQKEF